MRSRGILFGTQNRPWNAAATRTAFFHDFLAFTGAPGAPEGRKVSPGCPKASPGPPKIHQKSIKNRLRTPWGAEGPQGYPPPSKMIPKSIKTDNKCIQKRALKFENSRAFRPFFQFTVPPESGGRVRKKLRRDPASGKKRRAFRSCFQVHRPARQVENSR